jgi:hypothetical protein
MAAGKRFRLQPYERQYLVKLVEYDVKNQGELVSKKIIKLLDKLKDEEQ